MTDGTIQGELHAPHYLGGKGKKPMKRRVMKEFTITEISGVDRPAQQAARAAIMKRDGEPTTEQWDEAVTKRKFTAEERKTLAASGDALPDGSYPIENNGDLENAVLAYGRNPTPKVKAHIVSRAKSLKATDKLPADWEGSTKEVGKSFTKAVDTLTKRWIDPADGAISFAGVLQNCMAEDQYYNAMKVAGPLTSALDTSLRSIAGDASLDVTAKQQQMRDSVEAFMSSMRSNWPQVEADISQALGKGADMTTQLPNDVKALQKMVGDLTTELTAKNDELDKAKKKTKDLEDQHAALGNKQEAIASELAAMKARAKMKPADQAAADALDEAEEDNPATKAKKAELRKAFYAADEAGRAKIVTEMAKNDEVIKLDGQEIRKSVVGEAAFSFMKKQAERTDKLEKDAAEARAAELNTRMEKRAGDDFNHLPGTVAEKAEVLKSVEAMPAAAKTSLEKMLKAGEAAIVSAFQKIGHTGSQSSLDDAKKFEKMVDDEVASSKCTKNAAMAKVRKTHPDLFKAYQGSGN